MNKRRKRNCINWQDTVVMVTGASQGIGRATALALADRGAKVGLIARSQDKLSQVFEEINQQGMINVADVCHYDEIKKATEAIKAQLGPIDILINCAGVGAFGSIVETELDVFERLMRINFFGTLHTMKAVMPDMMTRKQGHIINIASIAGRIGAPFEAAYSASKFAVVGMSEIAALEALHHNVRVSIINPGPVQTDFFATRGHPYALNWPQPTAKEKIVDAIIKVIEKGSKEQFVPPWFAAAYSARVLLPSLYMNLVRKAYRVYLAPPLDEKE